ncbi:MAG: hypothetical protein RL344_535 [Pseudomonadota bacterium]|jgi:hypothetical protein
MQAQAIKLNEGWFIKNLPGFQDIKQDVITVEVELSVQASPDLDYKDLRGIVIMDRYFEKRQRETMNPERSADSRAAFRKKFNIDSINLAAEIKGA